MKTDKNALLWLFEYWSVSWCWLSFSIGPNTSTLSVQSVLWWAFLKTCWYNFWRIEVYIHAICKSVSQHRVCDFWLKTFLFSIHSLKHSPHNTVFYWQRAYLFDWKQTFLEDLTCSVESCEPGSLLACEKQDVQKCQNRIQNHEDVKKYCPQQLWWSAAILCHFAVHV